MDLASRSPDGVLLLATNSTHVIQLDQLAAVVDVIRQAVEAARQKVP